MNNSDSIDKSTVDHFRKEWKKFDQSNLNKEEHNNLFMNYFDIVTFDQIPPHSQVADVGCGSGRWAKMIAEKVGKLYCIDTKEYWK